MGLIEKIMWILRHDVSCFILLPNNIERRLDVY